MRRTTLAAIAVTAGSAALGAGIAASYAATLLPRYRMKRFETNASYASLPFPFDASGGLDPDDLPEVIGADFDPSDIDEISVAGTGGVLAYATSVTEAGVPGTTRDIVVLSEGGRGPIRLSDAAGDNDQPSLDADARGWRIAFRGSEGARGASPGNLFLGTFEPEEADPPTPAPSKAKKADGTVDVVQVTELVATTTDPDFGTAKDPSLVARIRVRVAESDVKVRERDARIAFVSTGDLARATKNGEGPNADHREQLFLWREADDAFQQLTRIPADGFHVSRPSISGSGGRIAFECDADLTPDAVDPKDPTRVGNPGKVRQIYLWTPGGVRQLTWSDRDCLSPRISHDGRFVVFASSGDLIAGGNPERNFEIFGWVDGRTPERRLRQYTQTAGGDSVLPRPTGTARTFVFWSTASHPSDALGFGAGAKNNGPAAFLHRRGRVELVAGLSDEQNLERIAASPDPTSPENPIVTGPPAVGLDPAKVHVVTNDQRLNADGADDDLDGDDGSSDGEVDDRDVDASLFLYHLARLTRYPR